MTITLTPFVKTGFGRMFRAIEKAAESDPELRKAINTGEKSLQITKDLAEFGIARSRNRNELAVLRKFIRENIVGSGATSLKDFKQKLLSSMAINPTASFYDIVKIAICDLKTGI